jgi:hypothetical protein
LKEIDPRIDNQFVEKEISILKKVKHENIIKYLDFFTGIVFFSNMKINETIYYY